MEMSDEEPDNVSTTSSTSTPKINKRTLSTPSSPPVTNTQKQKQPGSPKPPVPKKNKTEDPIPIFKSTLAPAKEILQQQGNTMKHSLNFTKILHLLENHKKFSTMAEIIRLLHLPTTDPQTIITQLESIHPIISDRSTKICITKLIKRILSEYNDGVPNNAVES